VEKTTENFPYRGKIVNIFSMLWKNRAHFSTPWKTIFHGVENPGK